MQPSECAWVSPDERPYSAHELLVIRQLTLAQRNVITRACQIPVEPAPMYQLTPPASSAVIVTRRHLNPHRRVFTRA